MCQLWKTKSNETVITRSIHIYNNNLLVPDVKRGTMHEQMHLDCLGVNFAGRKTTIMKPNIQNYTIKSVPRKARERLEGTLKN